MNKKHVIRGHVMLQHAIAVSRGALEIMLVMVGKVLQISGVA